MQRLTGCMSMLVVDHTVWAQSCHGIRSISLNHFLIQRYTMPIIQLHIFSKVALLMEALSVLLESSTFYFA